MDIDRSGRGRRRLLAVAAAAAVTALCGVLAVPASAINLRTDLVSESFRNATTSTGQWQAPGSSNAACLTAGADASATPIMGCALGGSADAAGQGALRLTDSSTQAAGTAFSTTGVSLSQGLDVRFNTYQWHSTISPGADGISFVLAATDPTNPSAPANGGAAGEGLGYATAMGVPGVSYGYLGLGLDAYGNFAKTDPATLNGCGDTAVKTPEAITVRGPGNGTTGYCIQQVHPLGGPTLDNAMTTSRPAPVPIEIAINPASTSSLTASGITVPANSWLVRVTPYSSTGSGFDPPQTVSGILPSAAASGFPASWLDPTTGLPYLLTFGWSGSTGGKTETHEISDFAATTLNAPLPNYSLSISDDQSGQLTVGAAGTVSVTPHLGADDGAEPSGVPVTVRTTFPSTLTPQPGSFTTNGYSCTTTGATVVCSYAPTAPVLPGSDLPTVMVPVTAASAGSATVNAGVSSRDSNPAVASHVIVATAMAAHSSDITFGADETPSVSGLSGNATGTVTFADASGTLCTATLPAHSCTAAHPAQGAHVVTATWQPTSGAAISASTTFQVTPASTPSSTPSAAPSTAPSATPSAPVTDTVTPTALAAGVSEPTVDFGTSVRLIAGNLPTAATGTVLFTDSDGTALCTVHLGDGASCPTASSLPAGTHHVTGTYSGDDRYQGSSDTVSLVVDRRVPTLVAGSRGAAGTKPVLTFTGLPTQGALAATGSVRFRTSDGRVLCTAVLPDTSCVSSQTLPVGDTKIVAAYSGDANHGTATDTVRVSVARAVPRLALSADVPTVEPGGPLVLTIGGLPRAAAGTVTISAGDTPICTITLPADHCRVDAVGWAVGRAALVARYSGDEQRTSATADTSVLVQRAAGPGRLAETGLAAAGPVGLGAALLGAGLLLLAGVALTRRRRSARS